jgi:polysaccharide export outer membrane protein
MRTSSILNLLVLVGLTSIMASSCIGSKPVPYFRGNIDTSKLQNLVVPDQLIQRGDILGITIFSDNPEATAIYNQASVSTGTPTSLQPVKGVATASSSSAGGGYLVDNSGNIRMHAIGILHVEGLTKDQLTDQITTALEKLQVLSHPYCVVRFNNFKITVLGEVRNPGVFTVPGEKASVLEALGLAGDITDYGRKEKVMLIRENQGRRSYAQLDLLDPSIFSSPNFYLRQNDVLVVEPDSKKPTAADLQTLQYITVAATVVSSIAILITLFK